MPMPMRRPEPLKGSVEQGEGGARLLDDSDVELLKAQAEKEEKEEEDENT